MNVIVSIALVIKKFFITLIRLFMGEIKGLAFTILTIFLILISILSIQLINKRNQPYLLESKIKFVAHQNKELSIYIKHIEPEIIEALATDSLERQSAIYCGMRQPKLSDIQLINK